MVSVCGLNVYDISNEFRCWYNVSFFEIIPVKIVSFFYTLSVSIFTSDISGFDPLQLKVSCFMNVISTNIMNII